MNLFYPLGVLGIRSKISLSDLFLKVCGDFVLISFPNF